MDTDEKQGEVAAKIEGLDGWLRDIEERGYTVVPDFLDRAQVESIRAAFDNEVMAALRKFKTAMSERRV